MGTLNTDTGQWSKTHNLREVRAEHNSWRREDGSIVLLAGDYSNTTEIVSQSTGVSTPGFSLKHRIVDACSITDTSSVVITGGWDTNSRGPSKRVSRYDETDWVEDLPSLLAVRVWHGCALYTTDTGNKVYLVIGGSAGGNNYLSTTEQLTLGDKRWRQGTALPRPLNRLRAARLDNIIYITGGEDEDFKSRDEIYLLDTKTKDWVEVARMKTPRKLHGLSVIKYSEVKALCTKE